MSDVKKEAYKIIVKVFKKNIFSDKLLQQYAKKNKENSEDTALLFHLVKGIIKYRANLDYIISKYTDSKKYQKTSIKIKALLYLALYQLRYMESGNDHSIVDSTVQLAKQLDQKVANFINAVLRSYLRNPIIQYPEQEDERLAVEFSYPKYLIQNWLKQWGKDNTLKMCKFFNETPKLYFRVNKMATNSKKVIEYFQRRNIKLYQVDKLNNFLVSDDGNLVLKDVAFSEGYISVQDPASGLVVELLMPEENNSVLDLFAAPGGKATYISEKMCNSGEVIAVDKYPQKTKKIKKAVERLQIQNMKIITQDAFQYQPIAPAYDRVLLDVPCSGWGVFQKKAELRWQQNQNINELLKLQKTALDYGAKFVKPGGFMVYSTCTLNRAENEEQIEYFLQHHKDFQLIDANSYINSFFTEKKYLKVLPFKHGFDGAFAAKMVKK